MFFCQNYRLTHSQNSTEFALHGFRESPRRLRETNNTPQGFCVFRGFRVRSLPVPQALVKISVH